MFMNDKEMPFDKLFYNLLVYGSVTLKHFHLIKFVVQNSN